MLALPGSAYLYQGEELGLPDHTTLDDTLRQDPTWERSGFTEAGRDGCRVPLPWEADAPGLGFGPGGATWLPQPDSYAALARDRQAGVPGSTLELYRAALRLRRSSGLGSGARAVALGGGRRRRGVPERDVIVVDEHRRRAVPLPPGEVLLSSVDLPGDGTLPPDVTAWVR